MDTPEPQQLGLRLGALVQDVGKIAIPAEILIQTDVTKIKVYRDCRIINES